MSSITINTYSHHITLILDVSVLCIMILDPIIMRIYVLSPIHAITLIYMYLIKDERFNNPPFVYECVCVWDNNKLRHLRTQHDAIKSEDNIMEKH